MFDVRLKMCNKKPQRRCCAPSTSSIFRLKSHIQGLTLIELLVVIVIITTLVGGVIPVLSPNNDVRKIQAAARGLQGYITVAQSQAARTGRPHGIAFRESSAGSGVALEVFGLEVPPPFAGFSTDSRCQVEIVLSGGGPNPYRYGAENGGTKFPQYNGEPIYALEFVIPPINGSAKTNDPFPPRTLRIGDVVDIDGNQFLLVDDNDRGTHPNEEAKYGVISGDPNSGVWYLEPELTTIQVLHTVWLNDDGQVPPTGYKRYRIRRQPTNSTATPYQLPASIAIDMQASVAEGTEFANVPFRGPTGISLFSTDATQQPNNVGIMFSPTGAVESLLLNGIEMENASRIVLLLGRVENGGLTGSEWVMNTGDSKATLDDKQEKINWLNLDSRLLSIVPSNGRVVVSEPAFVDARQFGNLDATEQAAEQIEAAHSFAHEMNAAGGN